MKSVVIVGWCEGFNKVKANHVLRKYFGMSIKEAKVVVDDTLAGKETRFESLADEQADGLYSELKALNADVMIF